MRLCMEANRFEMQAGQTLELRNGKGAHLELLSGELWITQQGDRRDHMLATGGALVVERNGITLLHAFAHSLVYLQAPAPSIRPARAIAANLTRFAVRLLKHFGELGMRRAAWRRAYRI